MSLSCLKGRRLLVGDERSPPRKGDFYGGWITSRVVGPFKGARHAVLVICRGPIRRRRQVAIQEVGRLAAMVAWWSAGIPHAVIWAIPGCRRNGRGDGREKPSES